MDKETRNRIQRATQGARTLLEREYAEQLEGTFDVRLDGTITAEPGAHLDAEQCVLRDKLVTAVEHLRSGGLKISEAVTYYLREAAFTTLNRFVALKMLEARGLGAGMHLPRRAVNGLQGVHWPGAWPCPAS